MIDPAEGGGLGTWDITGANPRITEIHAGSYIFSDACVRSLRRFSSRSVSSLMRWRSSSTCVVAIGAV